MVVLEHTKKEPQSASNAPDALVILRIDDLAAMVKAAQGAASCPRNYPTFFKQHARLKYKR